MHKSERRVAPQDQEGKAVELCDAGVFVWLVLCWGNSFGNSVAAPYGFQHKRAIRVPATKLPPASLACIVPWLALLALLSARHLICSAPRLPLKLPRPLDSLMPKMVTKMADQSAVGQGACPSSAGTEHARTGTCIDAARDRQAHIEWP